MYNYYITFIFAIGKITLKVEKKDTIKRHLHIDINLVPIFGMTNKYYYNTY